MEKRAKPRTEWCRPAVPPPLDYPHALNTLPESAAFLRKTSAIGLDVGANWIDDTAAFQCGLMRTLAIACARCAHIVHFAWLPIANEGAGDV